MNSPLDFTVKNIDGKEESLNAYKGKTVLIVNVASKCGLTPQYEGLQELYDKNKDKGFTILGFPSNEFMGQEPGTEAEIKDFCELNYKVSFPLFSKMKVKIGAEQSPLYKFLTSQSETIGDVEWNFQKYLVDKTGKVVKKFHPKVTPGEIGKELPEYL